ncbi:MFS transporter [Mycolicibacterium sp.]|uniref:MFS transporter n=1 Tax=Mycolicibacterium sp. TaxID=2320850 RepID=UPI0025F322A3|nr:MFS transporter [Mycolicibacterium sp.]
MAVKTMPSRRSLRALDALNFFLADVRDGLGPYLAIYLIAVRGPSHGWDEATVGSVITIAGIVGLLAQTPAGSLIDRARNRRAIVIVAALAVTVSSVALPFVDGFALITLTQGIASLAGAVFAPAIAAITLGLTGPRLFAPRIGRNEAFNHAGNATAAGIAALLAWSLGPVVVFWLMGVLAVLSIMATSCIRGDEIDDDLARGLTDDDGDSEVGAWSTLVTNRPLLVFAIVAFTFHLANAAMLTSVSQLLTRVVGKDSATSLVALCVLAAQVVMIPVAMVVGRKTDRWGRKPIFLLAFGVLALRGVLYTVSDDATWLLAVQALDGVGAGIFGALFPIVVADLTRGSGRFNVAQGAVATVQGLGAALSATVAGFVIVTQGYTIAFYVLAAIAGVGFVLYARFMPETKPAPDASSVAA